MRRTALGVVAALGLAGCTTVVTPPAPSALRIEVTDLPAGMSGRIHVTGPGVDRQLTGTTDLGGVAPGRYRVAAEPLRGPGPATTYPVQGVLDLDVQPGELARTTVGYGVVVPDTTKVLDAANPGLTSAAGPTLTFAPNAGSFAPGQILVAGIGPKTPHGLLRRVVAVHNGPNGVVVRTAPATLPDAVPQGELALQHHGFGSTTVHNLHRAPSAALNMDLDLAKVEGAKPEGPCKGKLSGSIHFGWSPAVDLDWKWSKVLGVPVKVKRAKFAVGTRQLMATSYKVTDKLSCALETEIPKIPEFVGSFVLMLGPVPVVITETVQFIGSAEIAAEFAAEGSANTVQTVELGVQYENGHVKPIAEAKRPEKPAVSGTFHASAKVGIRFGLQLYGVAGPYLDLTAGIRAEPRGGGLTGCMGLYGDMGWKITGTDVSLDVADIVSLQRQAFPDFWAKCPLGEESKDKRKVAPHKKKVTAEDYQWLVGDWVRDIADPTGVKAYLQHETIHVGADGKVIYTTESGIEIEYTYKNPIQCEGVLAYTDAGVLAVDTSHGPAGYQDVCRSTFDQQSIAYAPPTDTEPEHLDFFEIKDGWRPFDRAPGS